MSGRAILLTRPTIGPAEAAGPGHAGGTPADDALAAVLAERGYRVLTVPTIAIDPAPPGGPLDGAVAKLETYDWVAVTSANAVRAIAEAHGRVAPDRPLPARPPRWAAVGPATRTAIQTLGLPVDAVAAGAGASLPGALEAAGAIAGRRVLLPRADAADGALPAALEAAGAIADAVVAYHTVEGPPSSLPLLRAALADADLAAVVFASGSAVRGFLRLAGTLGLAERAARLPVVSIGPSSSAAVRDHGLTLAAEARAPSPDAIADALGRAVPPAPTLSESAR